jgi:hypothetical protein
MKRFLLLICFLIVSMPCYVKSSERHGLYRHEIEAFEALQCKAYAIDAEIRRLKEEEKNAEYWKSGAK